MWTPAVRTGTASRHAKATIAPVALRAPRAEQPTWPPAFGQLRPIEESGPDPVIDTGPMGLHKFDLGYIPASVTPPASWRRAAWFTVFCSAAALVGLLFVTSELVGPVQVAGDINSLPGLPTGLPYYTPPTSTSIPPNLAHNRPPSRLRQPNRPGGAGQPTDPQGLPITTGDGSGSGQNVPPGGGGGAQGSATVPTTVVTAPSTVTTVNSGPPAVDPGKLGTRTEQFFGEVVGNVNAAASLTSDTVRDNAKAIIEQNYGDVSTIQIKSVSVDPSNGLTVSVLQVTNKDGSVSTQQRTLQFTLSGDPKIENPGG